MNDYSQEDNKWYFVKEVDEVDTPALVVYEHRVEQNITILKSMVDGDVAKLRPHVKTHKTKEATLLMLQAGISKYKGATIAEAEMLAMCKVPDILLAYQPLGPKLQRFISLIKKYPDSRFSCLVDNIESAKAIATVASANNLTIPVYIDINVGMNRTGVLPESRAIQLYEQCSGSTGINPIGLHAYDGHIRHTDLTKRIEACDRAFALVQRLQTQLVEQGFPEPTIVAGGSPTFYVHAKRKNIECSPGTFIYWDKGYSSLCPEQSFLTSALVLTRIISLPDETKLCLDLGHKSVASENDLDKRVYFLNAPELRFVSHSEEHLVVETSADHNYKVGEVLYGLPFHICPTVALFERVLTVKNNFISGEWRNIARDRKITI